MNIETLRLECLRLAQLAHNGHADKSEVVERARAYTDFVLGGRDSEIVAAAREFAARMAA